MTVWLIARPVNPDVKDGKQEFWQDDNEWVESKDDATHYHSKRQAEENLFVDDDATVVEYDPDPIEYGSPI